MKRSARGLLFLFSPSRPPRDCGVVEVALVFPFFFSLTTLQLTRGQYPSISFPLVVLETARPVPWFFFSFFFPCIQGGPGNRRPGLFFSLSPFPQSEEELTTGAAPTVFSFFFSPFLSPLRRLFDVGYGLSYTIFFLFPRTAPRT